MRRLLLFAFALCALALAGCATDEHTAELIRRAESVVAEHPDSALNIVRSIDADRIRSRHDIAHYQLVMSEVYYYNIIDSDNDSITHPMAEYYMYSDIHSERARAMYQHALVKYNAKNNAEAMYYLIEAEKSLKHVDDPRLAGVIHRQKGEIYGVECLFDNALQEYKNAYVDFERCNLAYHRMVTKYDIGDLYSKKGEYDKAAEILTPLIDICIKEDETTFLISVLIASSFNSIKCGKIEECANNILLYEKYNESDFYEQQYHFIKAIFEARKKNKDVALASLTQALSYPLNDYVQAEYYAHLVYKELNCLDQALYYLDQSERRQDKIVREVLQQPVLNVHIDLLKNELDQKRHQLKYNNTIVFTVVIVSILLIVTLLLYFRIRKVAQDRDIANYIAVINEMQQTVREKDNLMASMPTGHNLDDFINTNELCEILYTYGNSAQLSDKLAKSINGYIEMMRSNSEYIGRMESVVNRRFNNAFDELRVADVKLNDKELRYILYYMMGFSNRSLCVLLGVEPAAVSRLKYKVKTKLCDAGEGSLYEKIFLNKA